MAATVLIREKNGAGETPTDKTSGTIRPKNADNATVDLVNPLVIPASPGYDYSWEKYLRLHIGGTGPSSQITNLKFYTDGVNNLGTGVEVYVKTSASYATPAEASSITGYTDAFTYTSGAPLSLGAGPYSSINTDMGNYLMLIARVAETASQGLTASETLTFAYDEI